MLKATFDINRATAFTIDHLARIAVRLKKSRRRIAGMATFFWCAILWPSLVVAQNIQYTQNVADTTLRSRFRVDPSTLGLSFQVPLGGYPGRGGASLPISLYYSSKVWGTNYSETSTDVNDNPIHNILEPAYGQHSVAGWTCSLTVPHIEWTGYINETYVAAKPGNCAPPPTSQICEYISRIRVYLPDGSSHELRKDDQPRDARIPLDRTGVFWSVDSSRLKFDTSTNTLFLPDGSRYIFASQSFNEQKATQYIDRSGNTLNYNSSTKQWTDALGRMIANPIPVDPATGGKNYAYAPNSPTAGDYIYSLPGVNGTTLTYTLRWKKLADVRASSDPLQYRADHSFANQNPPLPSPHLFETSPGTLGLNQASAASEALASGGVGNRLCSDDQLFDPTVLYEIVLPNNTFYRFNYSVYGEIAKVSYPTGGYERFEYDRVSGTSYLQPIYAQTNRGVTDHRISPSGSGADEIQWQYSLEYSDSNSAYMTTILAPDGTRTERLIHPSLSSGLVYFGFDDARAGMAYEERIFSSASQMIRRTLTEWSQDGPTPGGYSTATRDPKVEKQIDIWLDTDGSPIAKTTDFQYDDDLNVTRVRSYNFVPISLATAQTGTISSISSGMLLRSEETTYLVNDTTVGNRSQYRDRHMIALPSSTRVKNTLNQIVAQAEMRYDESGYPLLTYSTAPAGWIDPNTSIRGNVTSIKRWIDVIANTFIETHAQYDQCGNPRKAWDGRGNFSEMEYSSQYAHAWPTLTRSPAPDPSGQTGSSAPFLTTNVFDQTSGLLLSTTDPNFQTASFQYNDPLNRLTRITRPSGGGSTYLSYNDTPGSFYVRTETDLDASRRVESYQFFDGLGRASHAATSEGSTFIAADTEYDSMLRVLRVSNPYRSTAPAGGAPSEWTTTSYDSLGRVVSITTPDGAVVSTTYKVNLTTVRDQADKQRRSTTDALGRMTQVDELMASPSTSVYASTFYAYDELDNLKTVTQSSATAMQTRTFVYDSLSRLKQATNPEQTNSTLYSYDNNGNLQTKTDPRGVMTSYTYDATNRITRRQYSNLPATVSATPAVNYKYDNSTQGNGRLTSVTLDGSTDGYYYDSYDAVGRVMTSRQITNGATYPMSYGYDVAGNMTSETYPSGRVIATSYDAAGRIASVSGQKAGEPNRTYASAFNYAPHGGVSQYTYGNNLIEQTTFNSRLQPTSITLSSNPFPYQPFGIQLDYGTTNNNGNVLSQARGGLIQSYTYDDVNRLKSAQEVNGPWKQEFDYDRFGNRRFNTTNTTANVMGPNPQIDQATNRFLTSEGYIYDEAGNLKQEPGKSYKYDTENRLTDFNLGAAFYGYDGDGRRVRKTVGSEVTVFVYNTAGQLVAEYRNTAVELGGGTSFLTMDHLGSIRMITHRNGDIKSRHDYLPFGEELSFGRAVQSYYFQPDGLNQKFTGKERDSESGLDYFGARYYSSATGRFTAVDPLLSSGTIYDPQTWNRYTYTLGNPLKYVDPFGLFVWGASLGGNVSDDDLRRAAGNDRNALRDANRIIARRNDFRNALTSAAGARDALPAGADRNSVSESVAAYGAEGTANGVTVAQGQLERGVAAEAMLDSTPFPYDANANTISASVTVTIDDDTRGNSLTNAVAHEGRHVADAQAFAAALSADIPWGGANAVAEPLNLTRYDREVRAYTVTSAVAQGIGLTNLSVRGTEIWNSGWLDADRRTLSAQGIRNRSQAINDHLRTSPTYGLTPANPGRRYIQ